MPASEIKERLTLIRELAKHGVEVGAESALTSPIDCLRDMVASMPERQHLQLVR